ncbi:hypothetical protein Glove_26g295 [Diversispora epigaea]|uniref:RAP domain-containing protein n=1 Tax=Diversispora epigaea TaxID=1348612 RepID=A0A397JI88_9GLOM|nr:hypothetical protein Glove_26g295 [Diversispora epigaea]
MVYASLLIIKITELHYCDVALKVIHANYFIECFSTEYINNIIPLLCAMGHSWSATFKYIKHVKYTCEDLKQFARSKNKECISTEYTIHVVKTIELKIVTKYLGMLSKNRRPDFLKTPDYPAGLELDIYYLEYGFAIEVQGEQHEKHIEFFHRGDPNNFVRQQKWDLLKNELCEENWIVLRYVWYYEDPFQNIFENWVL